MVYSVSPSKLNFIMKFIFIFDLHIIPAVKCQNSTFGPPGSGGGLSPPASLGHPVSQH